jgi:centrin-3
VALRALGFELDKPEVSRILMTHGENMPGAMISQSTQRYHVSQMQISQAAFMRVAGEKILNRDPQMEVERAFYMFDQDRKGYIVLDDLRRVARDLGESGLEEEELKAMINEFDYDGNQSVSKEAFYAICLQ